MITNQYFEVLYDLIYHNTCGIKILTSDVKYHYNTLEAFLIGSIATVDGQLDDGWGSPFSVKGREIEATVLFSDIAGFSKRTHGLSPTEILIFVNHFFAWITAEALSDSKGIIDKYIGDKIMIVFAQEFGSMNPFAEALEVARKMSDYDVYGFCPHIGIASGKVIIGYVGTPLKYNCSVFGEVVALAARCAAVRPDGSEHHTGSSIVFPSTEWRGLDSDQIFPARRYQKPDGSIYEQPTPWELLSPRIVQMKNMPDVEIREVVNRAVHFPTQKPEERARVGLRDLQDAGRFWPNKS